MSQRLTNSIRSTILKKARSKAFDTKDADIQCKFNQFGEQLYRHSYGAYEAKMREFPPGYFFTYDKRDIRVKEPDEFGWVTINVQFSDLKPFPRSTIEYDQIGIGHPMHADIAPLIQELHGLRKEKEEFELNVSSILFSVHTVERLLEVWPEIADMVPKQEKKALPIPVDLTVKLNDLLGLNGGAA